MPESFDTKLDDLINSYFEDASRSLKELHDEVASALELKLMALREETIEDDE